MRVFACYPNIPAQSTIRTAVAVVFPLYGIDGARLSSLILFVPSRSSTTSCRMPLYRPSPLIEGFMDLGFGWITHYGYIAIVFLLMLGIVGLPVPGEALLTLSSICLLR